MTDKKKNSKNKYWIFGGLAVVALLLLSRSASAARSSELQTSDFSSYPDEIKRALELAGFKDGIDLSTLPVHEQLRYIELSAMTPEQIIERLTAPARRITAATTVTGSQANYIPGSTSLLSTFQAGGLGLKGYSGTTTQQPAAASVSIPVGSPFIFGTKKVF